MARRALPLLPVAVLLTAVAEIAAFVAVSHWIGAGWALLGGIALSIAGMSLLRREGLKAWRRFQDAAGQGEPPGPRVSDGLVGLLGALLLAVPGFVTAVVGVLLMLPPLRGLARRKVQSLAEGRMTAAAAGDLFGPRKVRVRRGEPLPDPAPRSSPIVPGQAIEGEIVDVR